MCIFPKSYATALIDIIFNKGIVTDSDITTARRIAAMIFNISIMTNNDCIRSRDIRVSCIIRRTNYYTMISLFPYVTIIS